MIHVADGDSVHGTLAVSELLTGEVSSRAIGEVDSARSLNAANDDIGPPGMVTTWIGCRRGFGLRRGGERSNP